MLSAFVIHASLSHSASIFPSPFCLCCTHPPFPILSLLYKSSLSHSACYTCLPFPILPIIMSSHSHSASLIHVFPFPFCLLCLPIPVLPIIMSSHPHSAPVTHVFPFLLCLYYIYTSSFSHKKCISNSASLKKTEIL